MERVDFTLLGEPCEAIKFRPDIYTAEVVTACKDSKGEVETVQTQHTDLTMVSGILAALATVLTVTLSGHE